MYKVEEGLHAEFLQILREMLGVSIEVFIIFQC